MIRLTTFETLAGEVLTPVFAAFQETYPGICVELMTDTRSLSLTKREAELRFGCPTGGRSLTAGAGRPAA